MIVHLLRHTKTEEKAITGKDIDRKLVSKGHLQCAQLKEVFKTAFTKAPKIYCSSSQRTRETAYLIFDELHPIIYLDELYLGTRSDILDVIRLHESEEEILIIGHNLGLSELASYLLGKDVLMKTSGFISIAFPGLSVKEISNSTGELILSHRCDL